MVSNEDKLDLLFSHWTNLPLIKSMPEKTYNELSQQSRDNIIEVLRKGIEDNDLKAKEKTRRHALSVQEINEAIISEYNSKSSIQNIYFHVNKLLELGFIQEVTILKRGKHNITYYGRTAKLFLFNDDSSEVWEKKIDNIVFPTLLKIVNIIQDRDLSKEVKAILNEKAKNNKENMDKIDAWIEQNSEILIDLDTDIKLLYELIMDFSQVSDNVTNINKKLLNLLKF